MKERFKSRIVNVNVSRAKRPFLVLEFSRVQIAVVNAPAFAKGGAQTVKQAIEMKKTERNLTLGIGDWNVDCEEFYQIGENERSGGPDFGQILSKTGIKLFSPNQVLANSTAIKHR